jgi:hypothetical protein
MTSNAVDNALDGNNSGSSQGIPGSSNSRLKNLDSSQTRVNILVGASGTEDDGDSGSNNSNKNVNYQKDRKHFHHHKRSRLPPKKLEVRTPSVQDLEKTSACGGGGKKLKIKNHQHHRVVWYFLLAKWCLLEFIFIFSFEKLIF